MSIVRSRHRAPRLCILLLVLLLGQAAAIGRYQRIGKRAQRAAKKPKRYIVGYKSVPDGQLETASVAVGQSLQALTGQGRVKKVRRLKGLRSRPAFVVQTRGNVSLAEMREILQSSAGVMSASPAAADIEFIEPDYLRFSINMPTECGTTSNGRCRDDVGYYYQFIHTNTDLVWAKQGYGGTAKKGAVIDTGVMHSHVDLAGLTDPSMSRSCIDGTCSGDGADQNGHGTHCAGIMAAKHNNGAQGKTPLGVMDSASIVSCRFMDKGGSGYDSDAIECIDYLVNKGVAVLSNSWGGGGSSRALTESIKAACQKDALFVAAAGNEGSDTGNVDGEPTYPAHFAEQPGLDCVLTVGASNDRDTLSSFSNYGSRVRIVAPGENIYSTYYYSRNPTKNNGAEFLSGTSMATPFVAGVALGLRNLFPSLTAVQIKNAIISSATKAPKTSRTVGKIIDTQAALAAAAAAAGQPPTPPPPSNPPPNPPPIPPPTPPSDEKCTPDDCVNTDRPICDPAVGCVANGGPGQDTCSQTCQDNIDSYYYDEYCYSPCSGDDPNDCTPTPNPTRTSCVTYNSDYDKVDGVCDGQGLCAGECLDNSDCKGNPQKPFCAQYTGSWEDWDFEPSECAECLEDADCPAVPVGWDPQCVDTSGTVCSGAGCSYAVLDGEQCTTADGAAGNCDQDAVCIAGCQVDDDCAGNPDGYAEGCYWYMCGSDGQCYRGASPKEPCKTDSGKQGACTRQGTCQQVPCPNRNALCYGPDDCCAGGSGRMVCLPNSRGSLRCQARRGGRQNGRRL